MYIYIYICQLQVDITTHSVVKIIPAIEAAFLRAARATFEGSTIPFLITFTIFLASPL